MGFVLHWQLCLQKNSHPQNQAINGMYVGGLPFRMVGRGQEGSHFERKPHLGRAEGGYRFQFFVVAYLVFRLGLDVIKPGYRHAVGLSTIRIACLLGIAYYVRMHWLCELTVDVLVRLCKPKRRVSASLTPLVSQRLQDAGFRFGT